MKRLDQILSVSATKAFRHMAKLLTVAVLSLGTISCSNEDESSPWKNIDYSKVVVTFTESDLQLQLDITYLDIYKSVEVAKFRKSTNQVPSDDTETSNKELIEWTETVTFASAAEAKKAYKETLEAYDDLYDLYIAADYSEEEAKQLVEYDKEAFEKSTTVSGNQVITDHLTTIDGMTSAYLPYDDIRDDMIEEGKEWQDHGATFKQTYAAAIARQFASKVTKK